MPWLRRPSATEDGVHRTDWMATTEASESYLRSDGQREVLVRTAVTLQQLPGRFDQPLAIS